MILVLSLFWGNVGFAKEIILDCYKWGLEELRDTAELRAELKIDKIDSEIDLKKKILHFDGNKFDIESETQRKIVAKKSNERITIDRYDGILVLDDESTTPVENIARYVCDIQKEEKKLF